MKEQISDARNDNPEGDFLSKEINMINALAEQSSNESKNSSYSLKMQTINIKPPYAATHPSSRNTVQRRSEIKELAEKDQSFCEKLFCCWKSSSSTASR
jgi:hypothetical protein